MIEIITNCPSCGTKLTRINDILYCTSDNCLDKQKKMVKSFATNVKIKGLGEKTIDRLQLTSIQDIYSLDNDFILKTIGKALGTKLIDEIEKSKNISLGTFLSACSIPLIGSSAGMKIEALTNNPKNIDKELCKKAGLGDKASTNLVDWIENIYPILNLPITFTEVSAKEEVKAHTKVCITGKLNNYTKAEAAKTLKPYGIEVVNTVSKNIDYLICDVEKNSSKEMKAKQLNINIITFDNLMEILKNE
jgi:NAD-dependent DNA ligase